MNKKLVFTVAAALALGAVAGAQFDKILKVGGAVAVVQAFGKDMNNGLNKLIKHKDSSKVKTKVVTILSVGIGRSSAVGAAQVMGPPALVDKVVAVAQPEADLFGRVVRLKALIPVSSKNVIQEIKTVDGVGVSGIIDIKL